ncbi:E3 ubiquitin-protein like [Actinidia chinensis var. chinensis]|uniref:E3 ubiquitin-protein ligase RMA n=1 Tax=Actinidia chinensis var. chinensis TaxID=1590841 RepID=A0A2R6RAP9_ACTCC|nr:E3 ubiquitin-protein like [Actinidia chinensis var. chinensis]
MAFEKHFAHEWKSISAAAAEPETISGGFDCNICLDFACDPVVTLCGHLYCWPCIYKWVHLQSSSVDSHDHPQCPVCKAEISPSTVVPLYGRGNNSPNEKTDNEGKASSIGVAVPPRPPACGTKALMTISQPRQQLPYHNQRYSGYEEDNISPPSVSLGGNTTMGVFNPSVGVFGEMVYARVFGDSESLYAYPNSYHLTGSTSPRMRRQEMQADKSLNRITIFLFCCFLICLLLF